MEKNGILPSKSVRLADHFPAVKNDCKDEAAKFFFCFDNNAFPGGLSLCLNDMNKYDECMKDQKKK